MFPLSDNVESKSFPLVTMLLIVTNIIIFLLELVSPNSFTLQYSLVPKTINFLNLTTLYPFVTAVFLHGGLFHIISNMWFLFIFGDDVEDYFGKFRYILFYLSCGILGNLAQFIMAPHSGIPILGASGAISGVLGAYYILYPKSKIKTLLILFIFITIVDIPAILYLIYWFFLQLISGVETLSVTSNSGGVAFWAHVAGFVAGLFYASRLKESKNKDYIEGEIID